MEEGLEMVSLGLTNYGYTIAGSSSSSISGNKTESNIGINDYWIISIDTLGVILWQKNIGGNLNDKLFSMVATNDGGYFLGGQSNSNSSGDKNEDNIGNGDYWVVKLAGNCITNIYYEDFDGDGYGNNLIYINNCTMPTGYVNNNLDCNDENNLINPSMTELCNLIDDNCNGIVDEGLALFTLFRDLDEDTFGNDTDFITSCLEYISGFVLDSTDCNDTNAFIFPGAEEFCNYLDDDCDGITDDNVTFIQSFIDADNDNFGNPDLDSIACEIPPGYVLSNTDCNDTNPDIYPGAPELLNGLDDDCDQIADEGLPITDIVKNTISIFPNPVNTILFIQSNETQNITIVNQLGEEILNTNLFIGLNTISVADFASGVYWVKAENREMVVWVKE